MVETQTKEHHDQISSLYESLQFIIKCSCIKASSIMNNDTGKEINESIKSQEDSMTTTANIPSLRSSMNSFEIKEECTKCLGLMTYTHKSQIFDCYLIGNQYHLACPSKDYFVQIFKSQSTEEELIPKKNFTLHVKFKHHYMYITNIKHYRSHVSNLDILITASRDCRFFTYDCRDQYRIINKINNLSAISCINVSEGYEGNLSQTYWNEFNKDSLVLEENSVSNIEKKNNDSMIDIITVSTWIVLVPIKQYNLNTGEKIREIDCNTCWSFTLLDSVSSSLLKPLYLEKSLSENNPLYFKSTNKTSILLVSSTPSDLVILDLNKDEVTPNQAVIRNNLCFETHNKEGLIKKENAENMDILKKIVSNGEHLKYYETGEVEDPYSFKDKQDRTMDKLNFNIRRHPIINNKNSNEKLNSKGKEGKNQTVNKERPNFRVVVNYNSHNNPLITERNFINTYEIGRLKTKSIVEKSLYFESEDGEGFIVTMQRSGIVSIVKLSDLHIEEEKNFNSYCYDMCGLKGRINDNLSFVLTMNNKIFVLSKKLEVVKEFHFANSLVNCLDYFKETGKIVERNKNKKEDDYEEDQAIVSIKNISANGKNALFGYTINNQLVSINFD